MSASSPAAALLALSRLASGKQDAGSFLQRAGEILFDGLQLHKVALTVLHPQSNQLLSYDQARAGDAIRPSEGYVLIAEDISLRDKRLGRIEVHSVRGTQTGATMLQIAEAAAAQIARYMDLDAQRLRNAALREEATALQAKLQILKALTRATGIVAANRRWSAESALRWLVAQATERGRRLTGIAQAVIQDSRFPEKPVPGHPESGTRRRPEAGVPA